MRLRLLLALILLWDVPFAHAGPIESEAPVSAAPGADIAATAPQAVAAGLPQGVVVPAAVGIGSAAFPLRLPSAPRDTQAPLTSLSGEAAPAQLPSSLESSSEPPRTLSSSARPQSPAQPASEGLRAFSQTPDIASDPAAQEAALDALYGYKHAAMETDVPVWGAEPAARAALALRPSPRHASDNGVLPPAPPSSGSALKAKAVAALPNLITGMNLASGVAAIVAVLHGALLPAAGLILAGNVFDALDGRTARALHVESPIGLQLDSLADVVSFGVAPALLIYQAALAPLGVAGVAVAAAYAFAGAYRLARFNVSAMQPHDGPSESFTGLPIPGGAGVIVALSLMLGAVPAAHVAAVAAATTLVTAAVMVSTLPYPTFKTGGAKALLVPGAAGLAAAAGLSAFGLYALIPAAIFGMYLLTGPIRHLYRTGTDAFRAEMKRKTFHQGMLLYLAAYHLLGPSNTLHAMIGWVAAMGIVETMRLRSQRVRGAVEKAIGFLIRPKEAHRYTAMFYGSVGILAAVLIAGSHPAIIAASVLYLALGDTASAIAGMRWGRHQYQLWGSTRSLEGTAAGAATALAVGFALGFSPALAFAGAAAFLAADLLPLPPDDNLWIPAVTAAVLALVSRL